MIARLATWWRRRYRMAVPLGLALIVLVTVGVAHSVRSDDPSSTSFLNPDSAAGDGAAALAARLRASGVDVVRITDSSTAVAKAFAGDATLFVPEPQFVMTEQLQRLRYLPASTGVVMLAPDSATLNRTQVTGVEVGRWWATRTTDPGCAQPYAAGPAAADLVEYAGPAVTSSCYGGGLVSVTDVGREVLLAGASDPFRNDRIGEAGNAALSTALLGAEPTLIWLDLHHAEKSPEPTPTPRPTITITSTGTEQPNAPVPPGAGNGSGQGDDPTHGAQPGDNPIDLLLPPWVWLAVALVGLAALVYALSRARRFGPPVDEPLPVAAYARETVEGRGRLYRQARQPADAFRSPLRSALTHIPQVLGLPAGAGHDEVVAAIAAVTRRDPDDVAAVLDAVPTNDAQLVAAVAALDELTRALQNNPTREEPS